jgi:hypothetical protein
MLWFWRWCCGFEGDAVVLKVMLWFWRGCCGFEGDAVVLINSAVIYINIVLCYLQIVMQILYFVLSYFYVVVLIYGNAVLIYVNRFYCRYSRDRWIYNGYYGDFVSINGDAFLICGLLSLRWAVMQPVFAQYSAERFCKLHLNCNESRKKMSIYIPLGQYLPCPGYHLVNIDLYRIKRLINGGVVFWYDVCLSYRLLASKSF